MLTFKKYKVLYTLVRNKESISISKQKIKKIIKKVKSHLENNTITYPLK